MKNNEMKLKFLAISENESFARLVVAAFMMALDPTVDEYTEMKTVVSEAVTNAVIHGYNNSGNGYIHMRGHIDMNLATLTLEISDDGCGIEDINTARQPLVTSKPELERSGMGFTIMESFTDSLVVESVVGVGTKVKVTKCFAKNNAVVH